MQPPGNQSIYRGSDRIIGGVCSGLAEGFHVEALWVRLAFVVLAFINGAGVLLYIVLWILMPERSAYRPTGQTAFESMSKDVKRAWADLRAQFSGTRPVATSSAPVAPPAGSPDVAAAAQPPPVEPVTHATSPGVAFAGSPAPAVPAPPQAPSRNPSFILGAILIVIGIAFLAANTNLVDWSVIWPAALVALGIGLLIRNLEKRS